MIDFSSEFTNEASCKAKFREFREQAGVVCHKCGGTDHYLKRDKEQWECKSCRTRNGLEYSLYDMWDEADTPEGELPEVVAGFWFEESPPIISEYDPETDELTEFAIY